MKEPISIITFGKTLEPEPLCSLLEKFDTSYHDYSTIKINGRKAKRDYIMINGGDVIALFKKEI
jgi:hypothetical protein